MRMVVGLVSLSLLGLLGVVSGWTARQPDERVCKIGDAVGHFTFKDTRYLPRSLDDFPRARAFVLCFTNCTCPLVQRYMPTLKRLEAEYRDRGVQFLALNVAPDESIIDMATFAVEHELEFPVGKDFDAAIARKLGVRHTPEVVVIDERNRLRYRGRIDDQYRLGGVRNAPSRHDLEEALKAVLSGREVERAETPVDGCRITLETPRRPSAQVTFAEHVAPILRKHCQECHRPGTAAPFSLLTYQQVKARAGVIGDVIKDQRMPPWFASPKHGKFVTERRLTNEERETLLAWVHSDRLPGDLQKLSQSSQPPVPASDWLIGEPDLVLKVPEHELPAQGEVPYKYVVLPYVFTQETYLQAVQIKADNPRVLHHCNMAYMTLGEGFKQSNFITGAVPGSEPMNLEDGVAFKVPRGAALGLQIHYVTTGQEEKCRLTVGLRFARGTVQKLLRHVLLANEKFAIPPGAPAHRVEASKVLPVDADGIALFSHMHLRGRDMTFIAHYPDGTRETLLLIPNYNFDWQMVYRWASQTKQFPRGTRLECIAHYDNSAFNPYNPDPSATVRDGLQTSQEMMNGFFFYTQVDEQLNLPMDGATGRVKS